MSNFMYPNYILAKSISDEQAMDPTWIRGSYEPSSRGFSLSGEMELFGILLILLLFLSMISAAAGLLWKRSVLKKKQARRNMKWEENDFYTSENSKDEGFEVNDFVGDDSRLPMWLKLRKEMIFPKESIEKMQQIGSGQFGAVFKGTFNPGNAK